MEENIDIVMLGASKAPYQNFLKTRMEVRDIFDDWRFVFLAEADTIF